METEKSWQTVVYVDPSGTLKKGKFIFTTYKIVFKLEESEWMSLPRYRKEFFYIPVQLLFKIEKTVEKRYPNVIFLDLTTKDNRFLRFQFTQ